MKKGFSDFLKQVNWKKIGKELYGSAIYPILKKYVESTEHTKWDDALLDAVDLIVDRLFSEEKTTDAPKIEA